MNSADPLAQLHDIIEPEAISQWPLALGWWLLLAIALSALVALLWFWRKKYRQNANKRAALALLDQLAADYQNAPDAQKLIQSLSQLLRRYALSQQPRANVAGLTGTAWLDFLNRYSDTPFEKALISAPYQAKPPLSVDDCHNLLARSHLWIHNLPHFP